MITLKVRPSFARGKKLKSPFLQDVSVLKETADAYLIRAKFMYRESPLCWMCSRLITNEESLKWGIGADCAKNIGLDVHSLDELENPWVELWIPKSVIQLIKDNDNPIRFLPGGPLKTDDSRHEYQLVIHVGDNYIKISTLPEVISRDVTLDFAEIEFAKAKSPHLIYPRTEYSAQSILSVAKKWKLEPKFTPGSKSRFKTLIDAETHTKGSINVDIDVDGRIIVRTYPKWIGYDFIERCKDIPKRSVAGQAQKFASSKSAFEMLMALAREFNLKYNPTTAAETAYDELSQHSRVKDIFLEKSGVSNVKLADPPEADYGVDGIDLRKYQKQAVMTAIDRMGLFQKWLERNNCEIK